jgi:hypothetical protein
LGGLHNLRTRSFEKIYNLGLKDFSLLGNEIDTKYRHRRAVPNDFFQLRFHAIEPGEVRYTDGRIVFDNGSRLDC